MRVVSKHLRDSARGKDCTLRIYGVCNFNAETTVLAHVPSGSKGVGMKGIDTVSVYACSACHDALDGRSKHEIDWQDIPRAIAETHQQMIKAGLLKVKGVAA